MGIISGISALIIFISTPYIQNIDVFAFLPETFGAMISYKHGSLFPIFPFSGFMLSGVAFGAWLQSLHQEKRSVFFDKYVSFREPKFLLNFHLYQFFFEKE